MSSTSAPFGLRVSKHPSGILRPSGTYALASAYGTALYEGTPVTLSSGKLAIATNGAGNRVLGPFQGVEYVDVDGKPCYQNYWTAGTVTKGSADATAYVADDPATIFEIQANGSVAQSNVGNATDFDNIGAGSSVTKRSTAQLDTSSLSASTENQLVIVGLAAYADNAWGDTYTIVNVQIGQHVKAADINAI